MMGWEEEDKKPRICINGQEASSANEEQIRHFVQALDLQMKIELFEFLKNKHYHEFRLWKRILSEEIQRHDTESRFPLTRDEIISVLIKIMHAYEKLPEEQRKILWDILTSDEMRMTMREVNVNEVKIIALNKAIHELDAAEGAVALLLLTIKNSEDRKELALAGIRFLIRFEKGNPEAAFRLLKLIGENTELTENEKRTISDFLSRLDPDFLEIHLGEKLNKEVKKLITERLLFAVSKLKWVPKTHAVRGIFEKHGLINKK